MSKDSVDDPEVGSADPVDTKYTPRLYSRYLSTIQGELMEELGLTNVHQVPRLLKVNLNMGVGEATRDSKKIKSAIEGLTQIAGQRSVAVRARKSVAAFKLREGMPIGVRVTLRQARMYEFVDRLISIALPRVRDFRGLKSSSFDGHGNYALGIREHIVFPEINYDTVDEIYGFDIVVVTSASCNDAARALLEKFSFPFMK